MALESLSTNQKLLSHLFIQTTPYVFFLPAAEVPPKAFEAIIRMVNMVHCLGLFCDKHDRNIILTSYIQFVFTTPLGQHPASAFNRTATIQGAVTVLFKPHLNSPTILYIL